MCRLKNPIYKDKDIKTNDFTSYWTSYEKCHICGYVLCLQKGRVNRGGIHKSNLSKVDEDHTKMHGLSLIDLIFYLPRVTKIDNHLLQLKGQQVDEEYITKCATLTTTKSLF